MPTMHYTTVISTLDFGVNRSKGKITVKHPNFSWNRCGVAESVDFRYLSRRISEMVQDSIHVAVDH